jgi:hypothetical protein
VVACKKAISPADYIGRNVCIMFGTIYLLSASRGELLTVVSVNPKYYYRLLSKTWFLCKRSFISIYKKVAPTKTYQKWHALHSPKIWFVDQSRVFSNETLIGVFEAWEWRILGICTLPVDNSRCNLFLRPNTHRRLQRYWASWYIKSPYWIPSPQEVRTS